ncbi:general stress protein [Streptosporangium sp. NPDC004379]|uniref:general stress protein n=1 Tax=Streptosporangium sp. NPDC004379 TaxID=3366189 RepID=UPI0036CA9934
MTHVPTATTQPAERLVVVDRRVLVGYDNYAAAQRTVDMLSDAGFPVEHVAIVGSDLRLEETVTGRMTNGRAALKGAGNGLAFGAVVGAFLGLFTSTTMSFIVLVLWAALWGAVVGAAFGFVNHLFTGGKRDFVSRSAIVAGRYDVLVAASHLDNAHAVIEAASGPADTVVVEVPPSAGTYDPDAVRPTAPSVRYPGAAADRPADERPVTERPEAEQRAEGHLVTGRTADERPMTGRTAEEDLVTGHRETEGTADGHPADGRSPVTGLTGGRDLPEDGPHSVPAQASRPDRDTAGPSRS